MSRALFNRAPQELYQYHSILLLLLLWVQLRFLFRDYI